MAGSSFFALLDDITSVLDDVATLTKVATKKTSGVLGDDLALNANQVSGSTPDRELPIVWAVAKGSALNKLILVPVALALSFFLPWLVTPLLMLGGLFLCYEGAHKILEYFFTKPDMKEQHKNHLENLSLSDSELLEREKDKIKGAVRTDFILSAEIVVISLGTLTDASFLVKVVVLSAISALMTVGVYGLVAAIVKMDDFGLYLHTPKPPHAKAPFPALGRGLIFMTPYLMKVLSIVGTLAMFMVGGGILNHGIPSVHHWTVEVASGNGIFLTLLESLLGFCGGLLCVAMLFVFAKLRSLSK
jgi:predicted DNA repair protein MutK